MVLGGWFLLFGRGGDEGDLASAPEPEPTLGRYEQTWTTAYGDTTCGHWRQEMDNHQRFVMAGDMLVGAREGDLPPDAMIRGFATNIGRACGDAGEELGVLVTEVAALLYTMSSDYKP